MLLSIAFGVALYKAVNVGGQFSFERPHFSPWLIGFQRYTAILEWVIAFGFAFYLISYFWDLRLSKPGKLGNFEEGANGQLPSNGAPPSRLA